MIHQALHRDQNILDDTNTDDFISLMFTALLRDEYWALTEGSGEVRWDEDPGVCESSSGEPGVTGLGDKLVSDYGHTLTDHFLHAWNTDPNLISRCPLP